MSASKQGITILRRAIWHLFTTRDCSRYPHRLSVLFLELCIERVRKG